MIEMAEVLPPWATALSPVRVLKEIAEGPPPTFSCTNPSRQLRNFAAACLEKRLSARLSSAACLQHEFLLNDADANKARAELLARRRMYQEELLEGQTGRSFGVAGRARQLGESIEVGGAANTGDKDTAAHAAAAAAAAASVAGSTANGELPRGDCGDAVASIAPMVVPQAQWQPDNHVSECPGCQRRFSLFLRRHHCRCCGRIFCNCCSGYYLDLATTPPPQALSRHGNASMADAAAAAAAVSAAAASRSPAALMSDPQRTCEDCYKRLSSIEFSRSYDVFGPASAPPIVRYHGACVAASCMVCFAVLMYYFVSAAAATAAADDHGNDTVGIGLGA